MNQSRTRLLLAVLILVGLAFLAYWPALGSGFVFDDDSLLTKNGLIRASDGLYRFWFTSEPVDYWPMTMTSFWIEWRLWALDASGYHLTNLLLHIGSALLLWAILRRLRIPGAYWAALVFTIHPVNVESVAWIAQRKNTLSMLLYLASIWFFLGSAWGSPASVMPAVIRKSRGRTSPAPPAPAAAWRVDFRYGLSVGAFLLAMLSKGSVAILPLVLLGLVLWRRRLRVADLLLSAPFFAIAAVLTLVNIQFQNHGLTEAIRAAGPVERLLEAGATVWFYLGKAILPVHLMFFYPLWHIRTDALAWWLPLLAAIGLTAWLGGLAWGPAGRPSLRRSAAFAWGYFGVALVPVMGFTDIYFMKYSLVADHYEYLAVIGVVAWASAAWWVGAAGGGEPDAAGVLSRNPVRLAVAAAVVGLGAILCWRQTRMFQDGETLYRVSLERNPQAWPADNNLGVLEVESGRTEAARSHFAEALRLNPDYAEAHYNLGRLLKPQPGGAARALPHFARAVALRPAYADAHFWLALCLDNLGRPEEADAQYAEAIRLNTTYLFEAHNDLAVGLAKAGRLGEALPHFQAAVRLNPRAAMLHFMLAEDLGQLGRTPEADAEYAEAFRLDPRLARPAPGP
jgi:tetratricopeptide (TPR) repeat protein